MLQFLISAFWFVMAIALLFGLGCVAYVAYLILSDIFLPKAATSTSPATVPEDATAEDIQTPTDATQELITPTPINDTLLAYLNEHHSPLAPVTYQDHLFSTLDMDSLDIQAMLRYISEAYGVELPIVDLFGRYGADPTVYQVLCYIGRQRQANS